ncbi:MAG: GYD domain-containing protein [Chloroflexi bacterium]|nr:GYD domain-containing protein [Chloroflexota bacterium]
MAYYLMLSKLTERGRKTLRENPERVTEVNREIETMAANAKVVSQWFLLGPYDFATIVEAPDNWNMAVIAMDLGARGTVETLTMPALRVEDFVPFMQSATHEGRAHRPHRASAD